MSYLKLQPNKQKSAKYFAKMRQKRNLGREAFSLWQRLPNYLVKEIFWCLQVSQSGPLLY